MRTRTRLLFTGLSVLLIVGMLLVFARPASAMSLIWQQRVFSSGVSVTSPVLAAGQLYRIVASEVWWYASPTASNFTADAMYYMNGGPDYWDWTSHLPAPNGASFLQINAQNVSWGPFSNGMTGHTYSINYTGADAAVTFRIVDWIDGIYANNYCHILVSIYTGNPVGGYLIDAGPSEATVPFVTFALATIALAFVPLIKRCDRRIF